MIIAVDIETQGLDATKYITGCIVTERKPNKPEIYRNKKDLWNRILELGRKENKRGHSLSVYGHNHIYDFYGYANLEDSNIIYYNINRPFIAAYKEKGKEIIKFLDTLSIYRMSLENAAKLIGLKKAETPEILKEGKELKPKQLLDVEQYMVLDAQICLHLVLELKKRLKQEGITVKRLYTINQIAINYLVNYWRKHKKYEHVFWDSKAGETRRTLRSENIHSAYRGGRVECFKTGHHKKTTYIDCNSLYPYSATKTRFPLLESERKIWKPIEKGYSRKELLQRIGISRCLIQNRNNEIGLLPIRTSTGNYYPKKGKYMIGTWTHTELWEAIKEGYKIIDIEWTITWEDAPNNPLKSYMETMYEKRQNTRDEFNNYFYKSMMNSCLGKLAQTKTMQEIVMDSVEKAEEYLQKKYEIIKGIKYDYMYAKQHTNTPKKKYYTPIIPTLVNAHARVYMYQQLKKIPLKDLLYTDTDSIMFTGSHIDKFNIHPEMGGFKVEHHEEDALIYGRKTYIIGDDIKISGMRKKGITKEQFERGWVEDKKMVTIKTALDIKDAGTFEKTERDLKLQRIEHNEVIRKLGAEDLMVDSDIDDIKHFLNKLNKII